MSELFVFGLGFSAQGYVRRYGAGYQRIAATRRQAPDNTTDATAASGVVMHAFDGAATTTPDPAIAAALGRASHLLVSAPPDQAGDPVLRHFSDVIAGAAGLTHIVYLSTIGVYGDHQGAVIGEDAELRPGSARNRERVAVEQQWLELGRAAGKSVHVLRLSGIYGPGRNQLVKIREGVAHRLIRAGQVFNRIHVDDIAAAIDAAFRRPQTEQRVWNITDSEPCAPQLPIEYAAGLLGVAPPPAIPFEEAELTPMARSFWGENKRVSNRRMREELGVTLAYPSYREGLAALAAAGEGR